MEPSVPRRTYALNLTGELAGHRVVMGSMSAREVIASQRGTITESDVLEMVAGRCVEHDFGVDDLLTLDYWIIADILEAWGTAMQESAVPPQNGSRSPAPSVREPSRRTRRSSSR